MNVRTACCGLVLLMAVPVRAQPPPDRFDEWVAIVNAHEPGNPDKGALTVATWSGDELDTTIERARQYARSRPASQRDEANSLLVRGANLHADIARLIPEDMMRRSARQESTFIARDGREQGTRFVSIHWDLGRTLLDAVAPDPAAHPGVRRWYEETSLDLLRLRALSEAAVHLPRARRLFPANPIILFASGILHERFASPVVQAAAEGINADDRGRTAAVDSTRTERGRAERFFRETLAVQPGHIEARVRHGRALAGLGRHREAITTLQAAIRTGAAGPLLYFAEMFLGREHEAMGEAALARQSYDRAAGLFPRAQSPRLALSQLARRIGDRNEAQRQLRMLSALPEEEAQREDPWWTYDVALQ